MESAVFEPGSVRPDVVEASEEAKEVEVSLAIESAPLEPGSQGAEREEEWQKSEEVETPRSFFMPKQDVLATNSASYNESTKENLKNAKTCELRIKVAPNEANDTLLDLAEEAIVKSANLAGRTIHREALRCVLEIGLRPVSIEIGISQDLDRCVIVKAFEPVPEHLFSTLKDKFAKQMTTTKRVSGETGFSEEHEEPIDGASVRALLDADYVEMLKKEMRQRAERDLTAFATPLERRAKDDEKRVQILEKLLLPKYNACHLPLPAAERPPTLSSFKLDVNLAPANLRLLADPTPVQVDVQLKLALRRELHAESLARQERKKREVLARAEVCEKNRSQLVSVLSNSRAAVEVDRDLMARLGVNPPQVALCRVACVHKRKPGFMVVTSQVIVFEPLGMFGFRLGGIVKLRAENCRSVMKGQAAIGIADSLCVRTDTNEEFHFYIPTIEDTNEHLDMVFELLWQVLRMNRWTPASQNPSPTPSPAPLTV